MAEVNEVEVLRHHLGSRPGEVHADRWHLAAEVVDVEAQLLRQIGLLTPQHPAHTGENTAVFMAAGVDRLHAGQAEIPAQLRRIKRRNKGTGCPIDMDGDVEPGALLQLIQLLLDGFNRLIAAIKGAAEHTHHTNGVLIASRHRAFGGHLQVVA